jgi:hypothetical protein
MYGRPCGDQRLARPSRAKLGSRLWRLSLAHGKHQHRSQTRGAFQFVKTTPADWLSIEILNTFIARKRVTSRTCDRRRNGCAHLALFVDDDQVRATLLLCPTDLMSASYMRLELKRHGPSPLLEPLQSQADGKSVTAKPQFCEISLSLIESEFRTDGLRSPTARAPAPPLPPGFPAVPRAASRRIQTSASPTRAPTAPRPNVHG